MLIQTNNIQIESFNIDYVLNNGAGFYSQLFFLLNSYLYCKENRQNFKITSDTWIYRYNNGWTDYFKPTELKYNNEEYIKKSHHDVVGDYKLSDYQTAINDIYVYNDTTVNEIQNTQKRLNLIPNQYDSIFIRRGDKLLDESHIIYEEHYLNLLRSLNPECKNLFVQTDDYNCFIKLQELINKNNYKINLSTLCEASELGTVLSKKAKDRLINNNTGVNENKNYINANNYNITKSTDEMNPDEIKQHTLKMIIGIEIVRNSNICVLDYQSNVGRFIKLSHRNPSNVYEVESKTNHLDYNKVICPVYSF